MSNALVLIVGLFFLLIGVGLLGGSVVAFFWQQRKTAGAQTAGGLVESLEREGTTGGSPGIYVPIVRFTTADGQSVTFRSSFGGRPAIHKVGQEVTVLYDPANPQEAELGSFGAQWLTLVIMVVMGALFGCFGCMGLSFAFFLPVS